MNMNTRLSPGMTASLFCGTCPSTLTGPLQLIGRTILLQNKKDKTCLLIYMTLPFDTKIGNCWGLKTTTVAVIMGALGTIKKDMENFSNKIPGNINIYKLQKITLLSTAHLLRWVLSTIIIIIIYKCCLRLDYSRKQNKTKQKNTHTHRKKKKHKKKKKKNTKLH